MFSNEPKSKTDQLVKDRGSLYGRPLENHSLTKHLFRPFEQRFSRVKWDVFKSSATADAISVCVFNIMQKLSRAAHSPTHRDHWEDIKGYAENILMILDEQESAERDGKGS